MGWFGLGKPRSSFGKWLDGKRIKQIDLAKESGVSQSAINRLCIDDGTKPTYRNARKIVDAINRLTEEEYSVEDFWN